MPYVICTRLTSWWAQNAQPRHVQVLQLDAVKAFQTSAHLREITLSCASELWKDLSEQSMQAEVKYQHTRPIRHGCSQTALQMPLRFAGIEGPEKRESHDQDHAGQAGEILQVMLLMPCQRHETSPLRGTFYNNDLLTKQLQPPRC